MPITYPYDLLATFEGHSIEFDLFSRQDVSRQANGRKEPGVSVVGRD